MEVPTTVNRPAALAVRGTLKRLLAPPVRLLRGFRVEGSDRLPARRRPLILVANHAAFIDSVYLILAVGPRFTICGAKPRLFKNAALRSVMAVGNILRVESHEQFLRDTRALLSAGEMLLVYPEMGRNPDGMEKFETWAAEVALASGAPLLPCYLFGTTNGHRGKPLLMVGQEFEPFGDPAILTGHLRRQIGALALEGGTVAVETR